MLCADTRGRQTHEICIGMWRWNCRALGVIDLIGSRSPTFVKGRVTPQIHMFLVNDSLFYGSVTNKEERCIDVCVPSIFSSSLWFQTPGFLKMESLSACLPCPCDLILKRWKLTHVKSCICVFNQTKVPIWSPVCVFVSLTKNKVSLCGRSLHLKS